MNGIPYTQTYTTTYTYTDQRYGKREYKQRRAICCYTVTAVTKIEH